MWRVSDGPPPPARPRSVEPDGVAEEVDLEGAHRFVWRRGAIVTAEVALEADEDITITVPDGRRIGATLAGRDPTTDVAVLRVTDNEDLAPLVTSTRSNLGAGATWRSLSDVGPKA